ncbi:hypothetical protein CRG98_034890 [Punica granatum]|uniref:Retroviral polymerase SH3-like domain-containing protein n=1 Tax=Punica granatum TaxID=22663 RepID=A0A2I0ILV0_PUNGR|nr:hypothetical protein CRG98_034890 [Punica granatum]
MVVHDVAVFVAKSTDSVGPNTWQQGGGSRPSWTTAGKLGHWKSTCWKLHGTTRKSGSKFKPGGRTKGKPKKGQSSSPICSQRREGPAETAGQDRTKRRTIGVGELLRRSTACDRKSPYEVLFNKPPSYSHLRVFGCLCYGHHKPRDKDKLDARAHWCIFVGYPHDKKGWRVYDLETQEIFISRDPIQLGTLLRDIPELATPSRSSSRSTSPQQLGPQSVTLAQSSAGYSYPKYAELAEPQSPAGETQAPAWFSDFIVSHTTRIDPRSSQSSSPTTNSSSCTVYPLEKFLTYFGATNRHLSFLAAIDSDYEPRSYQEAALDPKWPKAMFEELRA